jgi:hypothetical protein
MPPFTKNDPRINRHGRPKDSFETVRKMAREFAEQPSEIDPTKTNARICLEKIRDGKSPGVLLEFAYGKVPSPVELSGPGGDPIEQNVSLASLANLGDTEIGELAKIVGSLAHDGTDKGGTTPEAKVEDKPVLPGDGAASP